MPSFIRSPLLPAAIPRFPGSSASSDTSLRSGDDLDWSGYVNLVFSILDMVLVLRGMDLVHFGSTGVYSDTVVFNGSDDLGSKAAGLLHTRLVTRRPRSHLF